MTTCSEHFRKEGGMVPRMLSTNVPPRLTFCVHDVQHIYEALGTQSPQEVPKLMSCSAFRGLMPADSQALDKAGPLPTLAFLLGTWLREALEVIEFGGVQREQAREARSDVAGFKLISAAQPSQPRRDPQFWRTVLLTHLQIMTDCHDRASPHQTHLLSSKTKGPGEKGAPRNHPEISAQKLADFECRFPYGSYGRDRAPFWPLLGEGFWGNIRRPLLLPAPFVYC